MGDAVDVIVEAPFEWLGNVRWRQCLATWHIGSRHWWLAVVAAWHVGAVVGGHNYNDVARWWRAFGVISVTKQEDRRTTHLLGLSGPFCTAQTL